MKHLDLFSGIGGFALAAELVWGLDTEHVFCDNKLFSQAILRKHWPNAPIYGDIRTLSPHTNPNSNGCFRWTEEVDTAEGGEQAFNRPQGCADLLTGGFPCQPFSQAGRRLGTEDSRHLWPQMLRIIQEFHPRWVVGENVGGLVTWSEGMVLEQIHVDLESEGYEVQAFVIPAVSVNAPHRRDRIWIVAHAASDDAGGARGELSRTHEQESQARQDEWNPELGSANRFIANAKHWRKRHALEHRNEKRTSARTARPDTDAAYAHRTGHTGEKHKTRQSARRDSWPQHWDRNWVEVAAELCRVDDGIPRRLDRNPRLKALGNAIVPQVAAEIFKIIKEIDDHE